MHVSYRIISYDMVCTKENGQRAIVLMILLRLEIKTYPSRTTSYVAAAAAAATCKLYVCFGPAPFDFSACFDNAAARSIRTTYIIYICSTTWCIALANRLSACAVAPWSALAHIHVICSFAQGWLRCTAVLCACSKMLNGNNILYVELYVLHRSWFRCFIWFEQTKQM